MRGMMRISDSILMRMGIGEGSVCYDNMKGLFIRDWGRRGSRW